MCHNLIKQYSKICQISYYVFLIEALFVINILVEFKWQFVNTTTNLFAVSFEIGIWFSSLIFFHLTNKQSTWDAQNVVLHPYTSSHFYEVLMMSFFRYQLFLECTGVLYILKLNHTSRAFPRTVPTNPSVFKKTVKFFWNFISSVCRCLAYVTENKRQTCWFSGNSSKKSLRIVFKICKCFSVVAFSLYIIHFTFFTNPSFENL